VYCGAAVFVSRWQADQTRWNSCAMPTAATPDLPVATCAAMCGCITSILRSPLPNRTHGIPFENA
jgi:hypothetical protein